MLSVGCDIADFQSNICVVPNLVIGSNDLHLSRQLLVLYSHLLIFLFHLNFFKTLKSYFKFFQFR